MIQPNPCCHYCHGLNWSAVNTAVPELRLRITFAGFVDNASIRWSQVNGSHDLPYVGIADVQPCQCLAWTWGPAVVPNVERLDIPELLQMQVGAGFWPTDAQNVTPDIATQVTISPSTASGTELSAIMWWNRDCEFLGSITGGGDIQWPTVSFELRPNG